MTTTVRQRTGVSTSVKGIKTFDCTVEITSDEMTDDEVRARELVASDNLVAALNKRYPIKIEEK